MKYFLNSRTLGQLRSLPLQEVLFAFDYDGTLAKIVKKPAEAKLSKQTEALIERLIQIAPVAIISGRSLKDLKSRLRFSPKFLIGNHGIEGPNTSQAQLKVLKNICGNWFDQLNEL